MASIYDDDMVTLTTTQLPTGRSRFQTTCDYCSRRWPWKNAKKIAAHLARETGLGVPVCKSEYATTQEGHEEKLLHYQRLFHDKYTGRSTQARRHNGDGDWIDR